MLLHMPDECLGQVLSWLSPSSACALRQCAAEYRRRLHAARLGMIPHVFGPYWEPRTQKLLTIWECLDCFAQQLLGVPLGAARRHFYKRETSLIVTPVHPLYFHSAQDWLTYHVGRTARLQCDTIHGLPLLYRLGHPSRYRSVKALLAAPVYSLS